MSGGDGERRKRGPGLARPMTAVEEWPIVGGKTACWVGRVLSRNKSGPDCTIFLTAKSVDLGSGMTISGNSIVEAMSGHKV